MPCEAVEKVTLDADNAIELYDQGAATTARTRLPPVASTSWCVLDPERPPADVPRHRWRQFVNDCHNFLSPSEDLAARAARLGWHAIALFGCAPRRPLARARGCHLLRARAGASSVLIVRPLMFRGTAGGSS